MKIQTKAVHAGDRRKPQTQIPVSTPVHFAASWINESQAEQDRIFGAEQKGYAYSRYCNPTSDALEELITSLENGHGSLACASGMTALQHALTAVLLDRPRRILCARDIYGATIKLLFDVMGPFGCETRFVDTNDLAAVEAALDEFKPGCLLMETISNPLLRVGDLPAIARLCKASNCVLMVDNTFATPLLVRPLELGAGVVIHSSTKYLSGHGDTLGGLITTTEEFYETVRRLSRIAGPVMGPMECFLTMRGIKSFALRVERQCQNAQALAAWLRTQSAVGQVNYPDDPNHPDAAVISRLLPEGLFGGMVSFEIRQVPIDLEPRTERAGSETALEPRTKRAGSETAPQTSEPPGATFTGAAKPDIFAFLDRLKLVVKATSLGDVHTMALYPWISSHRDVPPALKAETGVTESLVRFSVGIEAIEDVIADIAQALNLVSEVD